MTNRHVLINQNFWNDAAPDWVASGQRLWAAETPVWGIWGLPEAEVTLLPDDMSGLDAIELGCGTGYVSSWMLRRGARVTGIDISQRQLETARQLASQRGVKIAFVHGNAEAVDRPDASFDFAISEYGAAIWCDPDLWLPEAWRLLRPGGRLVFLGSHPMTILCTDARGAPCDTGLHRPYRDLRSADWTQVEIDPGGIEFNRSFSGWLDLFRRTGFEVQNYLELYAPAGTTQDQFSIPAAWAQKYPAEQVWFLRKPA